MGPPSARPRGRPPLGAPVRNWSLYLHRAQPQQLSHDNSTATPWADMTPRTLLNRPGRAGPGLALPVGHPAEPVAGGAGALVLRSEVGPASAEGQMRVRARASHTLRSLGGCELQ